MTGYRLCEAVSPSHFNCYYVLLRDRWQSDRFTCRRSVVVGRSIDRQGRHQGACETITSKQNRMHESRVT